MSESKNTSSIKELETLRDELKLKAHLLKLDSKDEWNSLEKKWDKLTEDLQPVKQATSNVAGDIGAASELLMSEISNGYNKIKKALLN